MPPPVRCAVGPSDAPSWLGDAVLAADAQLVEVEQAEVLVWFHSGPDELRAALQRGPQLELVVLPSAGVEAYVDVLDERRRFTAAKGVFADPVAEHALALLLAGRRAIGTYAQRREWSPATGANLLGARVVVVGGGGITRTFLRLLGPFGAETTVVRAHPEPVPGADTVVTTEELDAVLAGADALVLACSLTPRTRGLIGAAQLAALDDEATVVNVGRGPLIVTDDLVTALTDGHIGSAMLDVTDPEPLPADHPLWRLENCTVTPHTANTPEMHRELLAAHVTRSIRRHAAGAPPEGLVDVRAGY